MLHKKCDNLLVEADIFTILGVTFCVTQITFNLIDIKNKNIVAQFSYSSIQPHRPFLIGGVVASIRIVLKKLRRLHCQF